MSEILLTWLNTEVDLSKKVTEMEKDFSNGYLLGELLYKFNQVTDFSLFKNYHDQKSKLNNFNILHQVLRNIHVNFNSITAKRIMDGQKGVILQLLYQIRSKLEKKGINCDGLSLKKSNHLNELYSSMKFRNEIPNFDKFAETFFNQQLQSKVKAQRDINMDRHLLKFEKFKHDQSEIIKMKIDADSESKRLILKNRVEQMKNENERFRSFQQQFEQNGIEDWKNNMLRRKKMEKKDLQFQLKEAENFKKIVYSSIKSMEEDSKNKIEKFEKNLQNQKTQDNSLIIDGNTIEIFDENMPDTYKNVFKSCLEFSNKLRKSITNKFMNDHNAKKERNRRRRKIIVEQSKAQIEIDNHRREDQYIKKLYKQSNQEKQLNYETYRVTHIKNIITENRKLRDEMYLEREEMDSKFLEKNEEEFLKYHREYFELEMRKEEYRRKETEIALKQKQRSLNTSICTQLVNLIVDIADEAFIYQQTNDVEEIDPRVWREWTQLFVNNQSVSSKEIIQPYPGLLPNENDDVPLEEIGGEGFSKTNTNNNWKYNDNIMSNYNTKFGQTFYSCYTNEPNYSVIDKTLDDCEFLDYIHFLGQWRKTLIPSSAFVTLILSELMSDTPAVDKNENVKSVDQKNNVKKPQKAGVAVEEHYKEDDIDNLKIPEDYVLNKYFGDLIDIIVDKKFPEEESTSIKSKYSHIPIKLSIIGNEYSGKQSQAKILSENYPFKIYKTDDLLKKTLEIVKGDDKYELSPVNSLRTEDKKKELTRSLTHVLEKEKKYFEEKYSRIKDTGREIVKTLTNGDAVSDELYVDLLAEFINLDFPKKNDEELEKELAARYHQKERIKELREKNLLDKIKRPNHYNKVEQELNLELSKLSLEASRGFIIVNFPNTFHQAKLLEEKFSNYLIEQPKSQGHLIKESFSLILDKSEKIVPEKKLIPGGLDYVFWLDVPQNECIRRAIGRRKIKEFSNNIEIENGLIPTTQFYSKINPTVTSNNAVPFIYHLTDNPPLTNSNIYENLVKLDDLKNIESSLVTRNISFENNINSMIEFYESFGTKKEKMFQRIEGQKSMDLVTIDLIEYINRITENIEKKENEWYEDHEHLFTDERHLEHHDRHEDNDSDADSHININNSKLEKISVDSQLEYERETVRKKQNLNTDLAEILFKIWSKIFENYLKDCKSIFKFLRLQRDYISKTNHTTCIKFIEFLKRPSKKQNLVLDYQLNYNKFMDDYPDLIDDPQVKEEHHQRVDDLNDQIFEIIETRKNEAIEERKKIMNAGWIENEMEKFYFNLERLYQAEIDKFIGSLLIIQDYYHNLESRPLIELPFETIDIVKNDLDTTPLETENEADVFPRIEKLYKSALRVQFQYDDALNQAEKKKLEKLHDAKKEKIKENKSTVKKNVTQAEAIGTEVKKEIYIFENEMKLAIKNEKAKYRFRITLLKYWGIYVLKNFRQLSHFIYNKLEDWIILSIKSENEALNQLTTILKSKIEGEEKIKYELQLDTFDVIVNMDVQNFLVLPPKPHPAKEIMDHSKFNIQQLKIIIKELKTYEMDTKIGHIRTSNFIDIFHKKFITAKNENDVYYGLPTMLKKLSFFHYYRFIRHLDNNCTDFLNINYIGTYFSLLNSTVCSNKNAEDIYNESAKYLINEDFIKKSDFIKIPMWFDNEEDCPTLPMYENFNRPQKLKELIYEINKDEEGLLNLSLINKIFTLAVINLDSENNKSKTYYEVLFY